MYSAIILNMQFQNSFNLIYHYKQDILAPVGCCTFRLSGTAGVTILQILPEPWGWDTSPEEGLPMITESLMVIGFFFLYISAWRIAFIPSNTNLLIMNKAKFLLVFLKMRACQFDFHSRHPLQKKAWEWFLFNELIVMSTVFLFKFGSWDIGPVKAFTC